MEEYEENKSKKDIFSVATFKESLAETKIDKLNLNIGGK